MPKILSDEAVAQFDHRGFYCPIRVLSVEEALEYRRCLEAYEAQSGGPIQGAMRNKANVLFTWVNRMVRHPRILDVVEDVLGPNILCWSTNFFIKEAQDLGYVSWHQDSTYWGLEPVDVVTAWVALSEASVASGAMKFLPGSHKFDQITHTDTFHQDNMLSRGQEVDVEVDESLAAYAPLQPGEMSLHHVRLIHGSASNTTDDRRIGVAIRYMAAHVKQIHGRDSAMLVRGEDVYGHFDPDPEPMADLDEAALAAHQRAAERVRAYLYKDVEEQSMYGHIQNFRR